MARDRCACGLLYRPSQEQLNGKEENGLSENAEI
jgi:hypothetical protein